MKQKDSGPLVVYDPKHFYTRKHTLKFEESEKEKSGADMDDIDFKQLLRDVKSIGSSSMSWKERKKLEEQDVVKLGGKPTKKHRTPLSVAKAPMKRQKRREQQELEEAAILGRFVKQPKLKTTQKRRPEDMVLKMSEGRFKRGVLDVKHLLKQKPSRGDSDMNQQVFSKGGKKGKGKSKGTGKGKKGNKRRR